MTTNANDAAKQEHSSESRPDATNSSTRHSADEIISAKLSPRVGAAAAMFLHHHRPAGEHKRRRRAHLLARRRGGAIDCPRRPAGQQADVASIKWPRAGARPRRTRARARTRTRTRTTRRRAPLGTRSQSTTTRVATTTRSKTAAAMLSSLLLSIVLLGLLAHQPASAQHERRPQLAPVVTQQSQPANEQRHQSQPIATTSTQAAGSRTSELAGRPARGPSSARQQPSGASQPHEQQQHEQHEQPSLGALESAQVGGRSIKNVTAQNGQSVSLHCPVAGLTGDVSVSWFRGTGDLQLLTYGTTTIIQDERFVVWSGIVSENDWVLHIKNLDKATDSGLYQCQSSDNPPQSQYYQLNVVEPQVHIVGAPDLALKLGSPLNLTCVISQSADQFQFIFWYRDERMINYDIQNEQRGKVVVSKVGHRPDTISSNLQIYSSTLADSGNYTCMPSGARSTSIYVHILEAHDKRLIMFQSDDSPPAASPQTNSAVSLDVARLSRGRAYALFVVLLVSGSWLQLVGQTQTAISLLLLAIIGLLVSNSTERRRRQRDDRRLRRRRPPEGSRASGGAGPADETASRELRPEEATELAPPTGELELGARRLSAEWARRAPQPGGALEPGAGSPSAGSSSTGYNSDARPLGTGSPTADTPTAGRSPCGPGAASRQRRRWSSAAELAAGPADCCWRPGDEWAATYKSQAARPTISCGRKESLRKPIERRPEVGEG